MTIHPIVVHTFHSKSQPRGDARGKVKVMIHHLWNHECLYNFLCQSVKWILCYFFTGYVKALTCRCHWMTSRRVTEISQSSFGEQNVCTKLHGNPYPDISVWTKVVILPSREPAQIEVSQYGSPEIGWARWPWYRCVFSWVINPSGGLTPSLKQTDPLKVVVLGRQKILTLIWWPLIVQHLACS